MLTTKGGAQNMLAGNLKALLNRCRFVRAEYECPYCKVSLSTATERKQAWWGDFRLTSRISLQVEDITWVKKALPGLERTADETAEADWSITSLDARCKSLIPRGRTGALFQGPSTNIWEFTESVRSLEYG